MIPERWLTATGVYDHRNCGKEGSDLFENNCRRREPPNKTAVVFGTRNQSSTLQAMLRKIARDFDDIDRIYYYDSQGAIDASSFEPRGPGFVRGRGGRVYDSGLIGADNDNDYDGNDPDVAVFPGARGFSTRNRPRPAFCAFRYKRVSRRVPKCD